MKIRLLGKLLPSWRNALLAIVAAGLLIVAFPDFEWWWTAWFALVPLMWAIEREKGAVFKSFILGWLFGTIFFFGTCWWLTYAPIHYAGFPPLLAYFLLFCITAVTGLFPGVFAAILSVLLRRFGSWAFLAAPFVWIFAEFLRYWITGNNWNAIGYSQADVFTVHQATYGGVLLVSFSCVLLSAGISFYLLSFNITRASKVMLAILSLCWGFLAIGSFILSIQGKSEFPSPSTIIAVQSNVPMDGLDQTKWIHLRQRQIDLAEVEIKQQNSTNSEDPLTVVLPESPMNFMYSGDREFQQFINDFARKNNVNVLFNSAEPDIGTTKYFNAAVMVGPDGNKVDEYDKIYLLPFGEAVPSFLQGLVPGFVGNFAYGREYDLFPVGDAKAGVMICFESHFGALSRDYVRNGADVIIEMTNDGYLGPTPVLRQHLANAVFRAVETNRPVLRVTNVGITAFINERGEVLDAATPYQEDTRVWSVSKSDGSQTFYVKYGDWFAWLCCIVTFGLVAFAIVRRPPQSAR